jgi:transcriptional regulator with XRE-family HTH domain
VSDRSRSRTTEGADAPSVGAYLARQRQLRGISLEDLEAETRIPRRSLARLEAGAFDGHTDAFARGFVRAVASALGLDTEETLLRLLDAPRREEEAARRAGLRARRLLLGALLAALAIGLFLALRAANPAALGRMARRLVLGGPVVVVQRPDVVRDLRAEARRRAGLAPEGQGPEHPEARPSDAPDAPGDPAPLR